MARLRAGWVEVRRLADGSYKSLLRYRDPLTRDKLMFGEPLYAATRREALARAEQLRPQLAAYLAERVRARREPELMALGDYVLGRWRGEMEPQLPTSTKAIMRQWWRKWLGPLIGNTPLSYLTPELLEGLCDHMTELGASWPTVETAVKHVRRYINDAVRAGLLPENPLANYRLKSPDLTVEEIEQLGEPEYAIELEHAVRVAWCMNDLEDVALAETMCTAGLRPGEARALRFASVLHPDGRPRAQLQVRLTISGRGSQREIRGTKTTRGRSRKEIQRGFRTPQIVPALGALYVRLWEARGRPPLNELLAPGSSYGRARKKTPKLGVKNEANWRRREFYPAVERAGVQPLYPRRITPREFRAAAASAYGHARDPELSARDQLGHSTDSTTLKYYFAAYRDPNPEVRGESVDWQLRRARGLTLEWMERRLTELAEERLRVGETPLLTWSKDRASIYTAAYGDDRYIVCLDGNSNRWRVLLGSKGSDTPRRTIAEGLKTPEEAMERAERQASKRRRQSLTIQRDQLERMAVHLRALVAELPPLPKSAAA